MSEVRINEAALYLLIYVLQLYLKAIMEVVAQFFRILRMLILNVSPFIWRVYNQNR